MNKILESKFKYHQTLLTEIKNACFEIINTFKIIDSYDVAQHLLFQLQPIVGALYQGNSVPQHIGQFCADLARQRIIKRRNVGYKTFWISCN